MKLELWLGWALVIARVAMGLFFLNEARHQLTNGWLGGDGLMMTIRVSLDAHDTFRPYRPFLEHIVLPQAGIFTVLVVFGEIGVGLGLVLGAATRLTAVAGIFMNVNFLLMNGTNGGATDALFIVLQIALIVWASLVPLSIDRLLAQRGLARMWLSGEPESSEASS